MKSLMRSYVYWPGMDRDVEEFVQCCTNCALAAKSPPKEEFQAWPETTIPWERIHIDYAGPIKSKYYLVIVDAHTKWPEICETTSTTAPKTIELLTEVFARFGVPEKLVSDNGSQFTADQFKLFCDSNGIHHIRTAPYHPQSNGQAERFVDMFKRSFKKLGEEKNTSNALQLILNTYRCTPNPNSPNSKSPAEAMFGRKIRTTFDLLRPNKSSSITTVSIQPAAKIRQFIPNDKVYAKVYRDNKFKWRAGKIIEKIGQVNYNVLLEHNNSLIRSHINQLRSRYVKVADNAKHKPESNQLPFSMLLDGLNLSQLTSNIDRINLQEVDNIFQNPIISFSDSDASSDDDSFHEVSSNASIQHETPEQTPVQTVVPSSASELETSTRPVRTSQLPKKFDSYFLY